MAFTKYREVITRKEHKCALCCRTIHKGEKTKYGVTTDKEFTNNIRSEYWCSKCT